MLDTEGDVFFHYSMKPIVTKVFSCYSVICYSRFRLVFPKKFFLGGISKFIFFHEMIIKKTFVWIR